MRQILLSLFVLCICTMLNAQEKYSRVRVSLQQISIEKLASLGLEVDHGIYKKGRYFESDMSSSEIQLLKSNQIEFEIKHEDVINYYLERSQKEFKPKKTRAVTCKPPRPTYNKPSGFNYGSMAGFFTYQEAIAELDSLAMLYPNLITMKQQIDTFTSHEGRPIYFMKLSDNPTLNETEPEILFTSLHHAREVQSLSQLIYFMYYLCENYNTDAEVKNLVDNIQFYFVPIVNPDGYIYNETTNPSGGGMWRKNRRNNQNGTYGVDLNRNYGLGFAYNNTGSSSNTNSATYRGPSGFSEPETKALKFLCEAHEFKFGINYHTFSNLIVYPWGYLAKNCNDSVAFRAFSDEMAKHNAYKYGTDLETVGYSTNGSSDDWMYGDLNTKPMMYAMTPEVGNEDDGFWPMQNRILPLCEEANYMNLTVSKFLLKYATIENVSSRILMPTNGYVKYNVRRLGLQTPYSYTVSLQALSPFISSVGTPKLYTNLDLASPFLDSISYSMSSAVPNNSEVKFILSIDNGISPLYDTLVAYVGNKQIVFENDATGLAAFTNNGWALDNTSFVSPGASIAENSNGNYTSNSLKSIETGSINLTDALHAELQYRANWELENSYDYVQVQASSNNGVTWNPLCSRFTEVTANAILAGSEAYTGVSDGWVYERINLDDYVGQNIQLQWLFESDAALNMRGFNMDDLVVSKISNIGLGVEDVTTASAIYPNPANEKVYIQEGKNVSSVQLMTIQGQYVLCDYQNGVLDVSSLTPGTYFLRMNFANGNTQIHRLSVSK